VRTRSSLQTALTYATFLALSLALHVFAILGNRPLPAAEEPAVVAESTK
jgi:hypothetical protein